MDKILSIRKGVRRKCGQVRRDMCHYLSGQDFFKKYVSEKLKKKQTTICIFYGGKRC